MLRPLATLALLAGCIPTFPLHGQTPKGSCLPVILPEPMHLGALGPSAGDSGVLPLGWQLGSPITSGPEALGSGVFISERGDLCQSGLGHVGAGDAASQSLGQVIVSPGKVAAFSALLPGMGQRTLGQQRWVAYVAAEAWAWIQFLDWRREGQHLKARYRDLAWSVARRVSSGPRIDGDWEYYEALQHYHSSGAFDADPLAQGVQPETDPDTHNGSIWILASQLFFTPDEPVDVESEAYQHALEYYSNRAYGSSFSWNWGDNGLQQSVYRDLIRSSDENLRRSTTMIGVILANHLLSAVDALVSAKLRIAEGQAQTVTVIPHPWDRRPGSWALQYEIRF